MSYINNPKHEGSGLISCIPQSTKCPNNCPDCFFQSGRSYLEPLEENLPNVPDPHDVAGKIVRINDGNDSNIDKDEVLFWIANYPRSFCNTSIPDLDWMANPVVLTINPHPITDTNFHRIEDVPANLMFVRYRTNLWNTRIRDQAIDWYSDREIPIVLTFMAYHDQHDIPTTWRAYYHYRKRTLNSYYAIDYKLWKDIMDSNRTNKWVHSCGTEGVESRCRWCGNCLREYYATMERMRDG